MKRGRTVAEAVLDKPDRPTAVFAGSDEIALGFMEKRAGVPSVSPRT